MKPDLVLISGVRPGPSLVRIVRSIIMATERIEVTIPQSASIDSHHETIADLVKTQFMSRLWSADSSLFGENADLKAVVANRLGWLESPAWLKTRVDELSEFAMDIQAEGFQHVVLLGMGGSSLCPEVLARVFGLPSYMKSFDIIDTTDPTFIARIESKIELKRTLFIVASKSGSTTETSSLARYFLDRAANLTDTPGRQFIAITDPDSSLHKWADKDAFRRTFLNPADIGGRYSALSYFGMVPASLLQVPLATFAATTMQMAAELQADDSSNPALRLGVQMACMAKAGRDKLTFLTDKRTAHVIPWIEQLVAESTGKQQRGIIPIENEPEGRSDQYGSDRTYCRMRMGISATGESPPGVPADIDIVAPDANSIGALFLLWEVATSVAGRVLDINPFDEPNVKESKDNTNRLLDVFQRKGQFDEVGRKVEGDLCDVWAMGTNGDSLDSLCETFISSMNPGDYCALLYFGDRTEQAEAWLTDLRTTLRDARGVATLRGYGPRYLHSIGQLYKGGTQNGHFIVFTMDGSEERAIPGVDYPFSALLKAQALGDVEALAGRGRPVLHVHLKGNLITSQRAFSGAWKNIQPASADRATQKINS